IGSFAGGGKTGTKNQPQALFVSQLVGPADDSFARGCLGDSIRIDSATIVADRNVDATAFTKALQPDRSICRFARSDAFFRRFDAMTDRVAYQVNERFSDDVGE